MKVLYLTHQYFPYFYTGTELLTDNLSRYMRLLGVSTEVWAYNLDEPREDEIDRTNYRGIPVTFFSHHNSDPFRDWKMYRDNKARKNLIERLLKETKPDILHVTHASRMGDIIGMAYGIGIPYISTLTDFWLLCPRASLIRANGDLCLGPEGGEACGKYCYENLGDQMIKRCRDVRDYFDKASKVTFASNFLRSMFERSDIDTANWINIRHGYNPSAKRKRTKDNFYRFAFTGTLQPNKGAHLVIEAFKKLVDQKARLAVYGEFKHSEKYSNYCSELAKGDKRIEFRGKYNHTKLAGEFADIDCVVVPSNWFEPFPFTLTSAISYGFEVIGSRIGGIPEIIGEENAENLFNPGDIDDLSEKMGLKLKKGKNGQSGLFYDQTVETEGFKYFQLYKYLVGK
ncbi:MAG: hypothetical protein A2126_01740 [Candidatus Woykebacteria bacterium GWB1_45_5]|uniref:Glycosyl transferase family 1 domain-containing protein n=2 Tax=Candidatus Woykeibacteriota TaxID=1817899 RepID=A0A1G1W277_9BACT|nr:MAG: hypothetical protein A2113_03995 [Candidatus Woykebacteria bacterium GWA1_44_8]OGY23020.1 MAG: hypothetical protein A2126_01740 [Candidatus Woykebacteria bacterium GWB1_45_5]